MILKIFPFIVLTLLISSCSIEKRIYRKGYSVDWAFGKKKLGETFSKQSINLPVEETSPVLLTEKLQGAVLCAPQNTFDKTVFVSRNVSKPETVRIKPLPSDTCGDMIYLKDGTEFSASIIELTEEKVRYRRCDKPGNAILETKKDKILMVRFRNGKVESYNEESFELKNPPVHPLAVLSFIMGISSVLLLLIGLVFPIALLFALATGIISLFSGRKGRKKIMSNVGEYKGLRLIKAARVLSWITLIIITIIAILNLVGWVLFVLA